MSDFQIGDIVERAEAWTGTVEYVGQTLGKARIKLLSGQVMFAPLSLLTLVERPESRPPTKAEEVGPFPYCCKCGFDGPGDQHPESCAALPTYDKAGLVRLEHCRCDLPCPGFTCEVCGKEAPWCFGAADDMPGACDSCWAKANHNDDDDRLQSVCPPERLADHGQWCWAVAINDDDEPPDYDEDDFKPY